MECWINNVCICLVSRVMREATYPFLALLCVRDSRMMIVERVEAGGMTVDEVLACLVRAVENNEPSLVAARSDRFEIAVCLMTDELTLRCGMGWWTG